MTAETRVHLDDSQPGSRRTRCGWVGDRQITEVDISRVSCAKCIALFRADREGKPAPSANSKVHMLDAAAASGPMRVGLCGVLGATTSDPRLSTCKLCARALRTGRVPDVRASQLMDGDAFVRELRAELHLDRAAVPLPDQQPCAGAPPRLTAPLWAASCKGAADYRCRACPLCSWEVEAERWAYASPWRHEHALQRPEGAPRWSSLAAALRSLVEFDAHGRGCSSRMGAVLLRLQHGAVDGGPRRSGSRQADRAGELVRVRQALERAFPEGAHRLSVEQRVQLLLARTAGVLPACTMPTYEQLSGELGVGEDELKGLVKGGRTIVARELEERGLIPPPGRARSAAAAASTMHVEAAE